jgi:crotonobetainyl-CoA:carnitine CoA-transferase CaiB-like acyl-CoA transferase
VSKQSALSGVTVLEVSRGKSAAFCAKILADLGADVLKLEPPEGDALRRAGPRPSAGEEDDADGGIFTYLNTSKQSQILDVTDPARRRELESLATEVDVLIEDEFSGTIGTLEAAVPSLIRCAITPFGTTGPYAGYKAAHLNLFHAGGESPVIPIPARGWPPLQAGSDVAHYDVGCHAGIAILGALCGRERTGRGRYIDISGQEALISVNRTLMVQLIYDNTRYTYNKSESPNFTYPTKTGYVVVVPSGGTDESFRTLFDTPGGERFKDERFATEESRMQQREVLWDAYREWCAEQTQADAVRYLLASGIAAGAVLNEEDLLSSEQLKSRDFFQAVPHRTLGSVLLPGMPFKLSATPTVQGPCPRLGDHATRASKGERRQATLDRPAVDSHDALPLEGTRVMDFTWQAAGPYGTLMLGLLGAEVIRVEHPSRPDSLRRGFQRPDPDRQVGIWPYGSPNWSPNFLDMGTNKRSLQLNLKDSHGLEVIESLFSKCDVVASNFRPGIMKKFGWDGPTLVSRFPHLVVAESSAYGSSGPEANAAGFAMTFAATGGINDQTGFPDAPPTQLGYSPDFRSGSAFALGILAALAYRERTGQGQVVDFSSREAVTAFAPDSIIRKSFGVPASNRIGNRHRTMAPHNVYPAFGVDRWLSIAITTDDEWAALCELVGRPDLLSRFSTEQSRKANEIEIDRGLSAWTSQIDVFEAFHLLQSKGIPAAPSFWNVDLLESPHLQERKMFVTVPHPELGEVRVLRAPWILDHCPAREIRTPGPVLGEGGQYVLEEVLQLSEEERRRVGNALL